MFPRIKAPTKTIYLDCAATTQLDPRVKKAMQPFFGELYGNPSSIHKKGIEAKQVLEESRQKIAKIINARPEEIVFTAGGTESVNLAIFGVARYYHQKLKQAPHLITTAIEHDSVLKSFQALKEEGLKTTLVDVDRQGFVNLEKFQKAIRPDTIFVSVMYANNEIGTVEPIAKIGKWLRLLNRQRLHKGLPQIIFHTDACQATGFLDLNVQKLGVNLMTINAGKIYGPKQTAILYARKGINLKPLIYGGEQEQGLRSGTQNVGGIVGFAKAMELANNLLLKENVRLSKLSEYVYNNLKKSIPNIKLNGPEILKHHQNQKELKRLPNNINLTVEGVSGEELMLYLDSYNLAVSTGSACSTGRVDEASHVLKAIGRSQKEAKSSLRITLGRFNTKKEINYLLKILPKVVLELRRN